MPRIYLLVRFSLSFHFFGDALSSNSSSLYSRLHSLTVIVSVMA